MVDDRSVVGPLEKWKEQLRRGGLELAILLAVSGTSRYGLEIIRYLESTTDLVVTEGTIYPILARLDRAGLVESTWVDGESSHPRKYYTLSESGRTTLAEMLDHWDTFRGKIDHLAANSRRSES